MDVRMTAPSRSKPSLSSAAHHAPIARVIRTVLAGAAMLASLSAGPVPTASATDECRDAPGQEGCTGENLLWGPIRLPIQHPIAQLHHIPEPRAPYVLAPGVADTRASFIWSNTANREKGYYQVDAETRMLRLEGQLGIADGVQLEAHLPLVYNGGGFTDRPLDEYHQLLDLPRGPRSRLPYDDYSLFGRADDGSLIELESPGTELGELTLGTTIMLTPRSMPELPVTLSFEVGLPTATGSTGQDGVDFALSLSAGSLHFEPVRLYAGGGLSMLTDRFEQGAEFPAAIFAGYLGADFPLWSERLRLAVTSLVTSALVDNIERFPNYGVYLDVGVRFHYSERTTYEFLVRENPGPDNGTTDVSFLLAAAFRFGC